MAVKAFAGSGVFRTTAQAGVSVTLAMTSASQFINSALTAEFDNAPTIVLKKWKLMDVIQKISGLLPTSVVWEKDPRPMVSDIDNALLLLSVKISDYLGGADDKRRTFYPGVGSNPGLYVTELTGQRTLTLTLKCEVYDYQAEAYEILERIRTIINGGFELSSAGIAYQDSQIITDLPTGYDNRVVNVAVMELQFGIVSSLPAYYQYPAGQGWVDTVNTNNIIPGNFT